MRPKEGDLSICIGCGAGLVYTADGRTRLMTIRELGESPEVRRLQRSLREFRAAGN